MKRIVRVVAKPPKSRNEQEELEAAVAALQREGHDIRVSYGGGAGDATRLAREAAAAGAAVVVAAGGDGTINEVVNGLVEAGGTAALGVVPMGTANDFARGLGLPRQPAAALRLAVEGATRRLDVAQVNGRNFINVSTGGFGASATRAANRKVKRMLGPLAYLARGARLLIRFQPTHGVFEADGRQVYSGRFVFFAVGNASLTGGGTPVTPHADPGDGRLDVVLLCDVSRFRLLRMLPHLRGGTHPRSPYVLYLRAHTVTVTLSPPARVNADGEPVDGREFRYSVLDSGLDVVGAAPPDTEPGRP